jgi:hypothetical protein
MEYVLSVALIGKLCIHFIPWMKYALRCESDYCEINSAVESKNVVASKASKVILLSASSLYRHWFVTEKFRSFTSHTETMLVSSMSLRQHCRSDTACLALGTRSITVTIPYL